MSGFRRMRRAMRRVSPPLRSPALYVDYGFLRPWMLPLARRVRRSTTAVVDGVRMRRETIAGPAGDLDLFLYEPETPRGSGALLWFHAGGHMLGNAAQDHERCSRLARDAGILVVNVEYRLGPFPADLDDADAALRWLRTRAAALGIDADRIAVGGASAGGGIAASLAQRALDAGANVRFQLLEYPMLDDRPAAATRPRDDDRGAFVWTPHLNRLAWSQYLGHAPGDAEPRAYAVPARRGDLGGLPPVWIGAGELDLLLDEARDYGGRLRAAGVACEVHVEPGMFHAADADPAIAAMAAFRDRMAAALREHVG